MKKYLLLILTSFSIHAFAQTPGAGSFSYTTKVSARVNSICNFSSPKAGTINIGTYIKADISNNFHSTFGCSYGANMLISLDLGSNPHSTANKRRMPLNGEQGDVKYYAEYVVTLNNTPIGINDNTVSINNYNSNSSLSIVAKVFKEQFNIIPGKYSDSLNLSIDYF